jgi:hypothetical protein
MSHLLSNDRRHNAGQFPSTVAAPTEGMQARLL